MAVGRSTSGSGKASDRTALEGEGKCGLRTRSGEDSSVRIVAFDQFSAVNAQWVSAASYEWLLVATSGQDSSPRPPCCVIGRFIVIRNVSVQSSVDL